MRTEAGADHFEPRRQEKKPLPYFAPPIKAACFTPGTITMHCALASRSVGMPLSGADMTSESTTAASFKRCVGTSAEAKNGKHANSTGKNFFILISSPMRLQ